MLNLRNRFVRTITLSISDDVYKELNLRIGIIKLLPDSSTICDQAMMKILQALKSNENEVVLQFKDKK